jgi:transcriptional regulator with PAS, ATPase and Fis domain
LAGNVRELRNILERAVAYFPDEELLRAEHLRLTPPSPRASSHAELRPR